MGRLADEPRRQHSAPPACRAGASGRFLALAVVLGALAGGCPRGGANPADGGNSAGEGDGGIGGDADGGTCANRTCGDGGTCDPATGLCVPSSCLTDGCPPGSYCSPVTLTCQTSAPGARRRYVGQTLLGHGVQQHLGVRDAVGLSALGDFTYLIATSDGRFLYVAGVQVLRVDLATLRVETISGVGWPGYHDGPAEQALFAPNTYQGGGIGLSPDERTLYFVANGRIRVVDLETGAASTLWPAELEGSGLRGMAIGPSGTIYVVTWKIPYAVIDPRTATLEARPLQRPNGWGTDQGSPPGFIAVDETRGLVYGLERNRLSGAFYRWPIGGGLVEWLNHQATGGRTPDQYLSDGPVAGLEMANPGGLTIDTEGFVYIGAGDGRTFRRYDPDTEIVESLCRVPGASTGPETFEWCIGDNERNRIFGTWPSWLTFDASGNGTFGYSVWPRLVRLGRVQ